MYILYTKRLKIKTNNETRNINRRKNQNEGGHYVIHPVEGHKLSKLYSLYTFDKLLYYYVLYSIYFC